MEATTWLSIGSLLLALLSAGIAVYTVRHARKLQANQWSRDELELRRDVFRRLVGYGYRLTDEWAGTDGEPLIALNEAWVVFADYPDVIFALGKMHKEICRKGPLAPSLLALVKSMAPAAEIHLVSLSSDFIERPFTPRSKGS